MLCGTSHFHSMAWHCHCLGEESRPPSSWLLREHEAKWLWLWQGLGLPSLGADSRWEGAEAGESRAQQVGTSLGILNLSGLLVPTGWLSPGGGGGGCKIQPRSRRGWGLEEVPGTTLERA